MIVSWTDHVTKVEVVRRITMDKEVLITMKNKKASVRWSHDEQLSRNAVYPARKIRERRAVGRGRITG